MPGLTNFTNHEASRHIAAGTGTVHHEGNPLRVEMQLRPDGKLSAKRERVGTRTACWEYRYDEDGRLERAVLNGKVVEAYEYGPHGERVRDATMATGMVWRTLVYDQRGQLIRAGQLRYQYNASGQLCAVQHPRGTTHMRYGETGGLLGLWHRNGLVIDYRTDRMGRPVEKIRADRVIERFHWLDELRLAAWEDVDNGVYMEFSYDESHCQGRVPLKVRCYAQGRWAHYLLGADQVGTVDNSAG